MNIIEIEFKQRIGKTLPVILSNGRVSAIMYTVFTVKSDSLRSTKEIWLDIDNEPESSLKRILAEALKRKYGEPCENIDKVYQRFWRELPIKPYDSSGGVTQFK